MEEEPRSNVLTGSRRGLLMRWQKRDQKIFTWHKWFAWYPIDMGTTDHDNNYYFTKVVWLETVERRAKGYWSGFNWEYRLEGDK